MKEFQGFYKKSINERLEILKSKCSLTDEEIAVLKNSGSLSLETADRMIENVFGVIHLPVGLATNFVINKKPLLIPMALEEPSVIAAASNAAKLCLPEGFTAEADQPVMIGQIQIVNVKNTSDALSILKKNEKTFFELSREFSKNMESYGGGVREISYRNIKTIRGDMIIFEVSIDVRDAMGANTVNTVLEKLAPYITELIGGKIRLRILTNLAVKRKVRSKAVWKKEIIGEESIEGVLDGYAFAKADIFRCATNNKGVMNGMDAVAIATGNDWRAVEAGVHAYASISGNYLPIVDYKKTKEGDLEGSIEVPLSVGTVGGAINTKPTPKILFKIMNIKSSSELSMAMASVGLANNFAALKALSSEGIQKGHMKLHARNIAVLAGAKNSKEIDQLSEILAKENNFSLDFAKEKLKEIK